MKRAVKFAIFALLFAVMYWAANGLLETKTTDGNGRMSIYKALPEDTVDVLMIGSSHVGMNVDTRVLWDNYGIAGYSLWSGMQPVVDSFYFVKEALKTQKPDVVVVEVFLSAFTNDDYEYSTVMKSVQALPYGLDKLNAALDSAATWQQAVEMFWGMPVYHERFDELNAQDYAFAAPVQNTSLAQINSDIITQAQNTYPVSLLDYSSITDCLPLTEKNEKYLERIISLCKNNGVQLVFLVSPFEATEEEAMRLNSVGVLAQENGVGYVNYLTDFDETGLDAAQDFYDVGHLNMEGIQKYTGALGKYLSENYDLPDRRSDESHIWNVSDNTDNSGAAYVLDRQFQGDGAARSLDTGIKLYENKYGDWTLLTRLDTNTFGDDEVYMACFSEDPALGNYGLLLKKKSEGRLALRLGSNIENEIEYDSEIIDLAIVKESQTYTIYVNGKKTIDGYTLESDSYAGTLLLGCEELSAGGERFRFSRTHILNLEVYDSVLDEATISTWNPETLPAMELPLGQESDTAELIWSLPEQFTSDASEYVQPAYYDTGAALYGDAGTRFTIMTSVTPGLTASGNVYFSCFAEQSENYRGLLLRQTEADYLDLLVGSAYALRIPCTDGEDVTLAIVKDVSVYNVYVNGELFAENLDLPCETYDGTLLIGCQTDENGGLFRFSHSAVNAFELYSGVPDSADILAFDGKDVPLPQKREATSVDYTMQHAFKGDGIGRSLDTGIKLYDAPAKDWTLSTEIAVDSTAAAGVYMSCFSEETGAYRGFMIRQSEPDQLWIYLGNNGSQMITISASVKRMHIVVTKSGESYTVCANGETIGTVESSCDPYDGTVIVGAQVDMDGNMFRYSATAVNSLEISDGAITPDQAEALSQLADENSRF